MDIKIVVFGFINLIFLAVLFQIPGAFACGKAYLDDGPKKETNEQRLNRVCPPRCWNPWVWSPCSQPCGSGGVRYQTRTVQSGDSLGECRDWVARNGCPGESRWGIMEEPCNRFCHNNGTAHPTGCSCLAGWTGQCCETTVSCGDPGTLANGNLTFTVGDSYVYGSTLTATCDYGYHLLGTSIRTCQADGHWAGIAPTCQSIFCDNLAAPTNGMVTHGGTSDGKTPFGQSAIFSCNQGYVLKGSGFLTCEGDNAIGQFNGQPPTCEKE